MTVALAVAVSVMVAAQDERAQTLERQITRIFASSDYAGPRFGPARWLSDSAAYTTVEPSTRPTGGSDIARYDGVTGERRVLVAAPRLVPEGRTTPLEISNYAWSADGRRLLIFTNTRRVWRQNTRGDYWVLDLAGGGLTQLGGAASEATPATLMFAKFSPDGTRVAYVRANNLYVERLSDSRITSLTADGSETTINGTADWVYEEELGVRDGFRWSPDGRSMAYWQFDSTGVGMFSLLNTTDALYPTITRIPYPKAGTTNSAVRIGVVSADGGGTRWMKTPGAPRDGYLARVGWVDAGTVAIQQLNRLQNRHDLLLADARTGEARRVFRDESKTWVAAGDTVRWIDKGRAFLWVSERDGWRHVYRVPKEGGEERLITRFDADIVSLTEVDGSGDDNVHYQGTEQLVNRLVSLGKRFDLMVYPNRTHAIAEGSGTSAHVHTLIARYFLDHLPPGAR